MFDFGIQILPGIYVVRDRTIVRLKTTKIPKLHSQDHGLFMDPKILQHSKLFLPPKKRPKRPEHDLTLGQINPSASLATTKDAKGRLCLKTDKVSVSKQFETELKDSEGSFA